MLRVEISKKLPDFCVAVEFSCAKGELLALVGPSGAGKTTIMRVIAGLEKADAGRITFRERVWFDSASAVCLPPQARQLGYVFQDYTLFPHLTVAKNVGFAAPRGVDVARFLGMLDIPHLAGRKVHKLSGGERQRVALAQALAREPKVLLLDEPFSSLDVETRRSLQGTLRNIKASLNFPILLVTHDLREAAMLADKVLPIERGRCQKEWLRRFVEKKDGVPVLGQGDLAGSVSRPRELAGIAPVL